jgi:hypothetical protein
MKVSLYVLDEPGLKSKYPNIIGFHFVSSLTKKGIDQLKDKIIEVTLKQTYIGEKIPVCLDKKNKIHRFYQMNKFLISKKAWLNFEELIKQLKREFRIVPLEDLKEKATQAGLITNEETLQAIRLLNDLGVLQFFEVSGLDDKVILDPQANSYPNTRKNK